VKVTREKTENSQVFLTIEMEPAEVEESLDKSYYRLVKKTNIPGFRKGKAPRDILERYLGKECLLDNALDNLLPEAYEKAIKEQEIEAIARPHVEIAQTDPVVFKVTVPLKPTIKLGDYHHIKVTPEPVDVTEDDVNDAIEQLRHQEASWEPVERPVEFDDLVVFDIESDIEDKPFINRKGIQYQVVHDLPFPAPGFAEQLLGMKGNEDKEFKLQFPLDFSNAELAGKEPSFKVRITEIKQEILPELDDKFAGGLNPDFKTLDLLREHVSADLKLRAEEKARVDFEERVIEAVVDIAELEFPPVLVEMEIDLLFNQRLQRLQVGKEGLEEYLRGINKTEEELREELRPLATRRVTRSLVLGRVAEEEKIEVTDSEIEAEIENMTKGAAAKKDELQKFLNRPQSKESIRQLLTPRKTIQQLVEIAKGSNTAVK
jgi:trigger factor